MVTPRPRGSRITLSAQLVLRALLGPAGRRRLAGVPVGEDGAELACAALADAPAQRAALRAFRPGAAGGVAL